MFFEGTSPDFQPPNSFSSLGLISFSMVSPTMMSVALFGLNQVSWNFFMWERSRKIGAVLMDDQRQTILQDELFEGDVDFDILKGSRRVSDSRPEQREAQCPNGNNGFCVQPVAHAESNLRVNVLPLIGVPA